MPKDITLRVADARDLRRSRRLPLKSLPLTRRPFAGQPQVARAFATSNRSCRAGARSGIRPTDAGSALPTPGQAHPHRKRANRAVHAAIGRPERSSSTLRCRARRGRYRQGLSCTQFQPPPRTVADQYAEAQSEGLVHRPRHPGARRTYSSDRLTRFSLRAEIHMCPDSRARSPASARPATRKMSSRSWRSARPTHDRRCRRR